MNEERSNRARCFRRCAVLSATAKALHDTPRNGGVTGCPVHGPSPGPDSPLDSQRRPGTLGAMGVLSSIYSVPPALMKKVRADHEKLGLVFGDEETDDPAWKVERHEFDKTFEERLKILRSAGYKTMYVAFDFESPADDEPEYGGYDIRVAKPVRVKKIANEIASVTLAELTKKGLANGCTDYDGKLIPESDYASYLGDLEELKKFFAAAAAAGHFVIAAAI